MRRNRILKQLSNIVSDSSRRAPICHFPNGRICDVGNNDFQDCYWFCEQTAGFIVPEVHTSLWICNSESKESRVVSLPALLDALRVSQ
jgi:hypothetical protein